VVVWDNSGKLELESARVIHSDRNRFTYGRFLAAKQAKYDVVFTQDDDLIVEQIARLYAGFLERSGEIFVGLPDDFSSHHYKGYTRRNRPWVELGFGSFFMRSWVPVLDRWIRRYGEGELLEKKADKIFTILHGKFSAVLANPQRLFHDGLESGRDANAIYKQKWHRPLNEEAIRKALDVRKTD